MMQAVIRYALLSLPLSLQAAGQALAADMPMPPTLPPPFIKLVPSEFPNGLKLVDLSRVRGGGESWRTVDIPAQQEGGPVRQEKVSVADGVRAMYAFPGTPYFANTKIEFSVPGHYVQDKATVLDALTNQCARMKAHVDDYVGSHPDVREKFDRAVAKGKAYVTYESGSVQGIEYALCTQNALNLSGSVPAMLHIFVPQREFIDGYIDFLHRP